MKTKSIFFSIFLAAAAFVFLTNCSGNKKDEASDTSQDAHSDHDTEHASGSDAPDEVSEPQFQVDEKFQDQLASVFASYVELKDAFVSSNAKKVQEEASSTQEAVKETDMKLLSGAAHNDWMNYLSSIQNSLKEIESSVDIEAQRKAFRTLTDNMYKSIKAFGLGGKEAFYEYCPMAFNNEGGYWLSDQEQIRNPYFGDKMLTCGEVKEQLK